jgi:S-adenosylmethionine hydrolase
MVYSGQTHKAREITNEKYFLQPLSRTFHGRDIFAPAGAHLARGARASAFGKQIEDHLKIAFAEPQRIARRVWCGTVLHADRFGNLITNFHIDQFADARTRPFSMAVGPMQIHRLALTYADSEPGEIFVIVGSSGYLEIAANQSSAARLLGCGPGAPAELSLF